MSDLQERIWDWCNNAFPLDTLTIEARHRRATMEIQEWIERPDADETADVVITLYAYAAARGFDLDRAVEDKFRRAQHKHPRQLTNPYAEGSFFASLWEMSKSLGFIVPYAPNVLEDERPSADAVWFKVAENVSKRGTCPRRQVGAVVVDSDGVIVSTGYNGAPRGLPHCLEVGCINDTEDHARCKRSVHAEANAIIQGGQYECKDATLYVTTFPCIECAQLIINAGINRVVFGDTYHTQSHLRETVNELFNAAGVEMVDWHND